MTISEIYALYAIPLNLQKHMMRVAAVGALVCDRLVGVAVDKNLIVKTLLLHDMGNILKVDFNRVDLFEDADRLKLPAMKETQQSFKKKYGDDPDLATLMIIKEVTDDERVAQLCEAAHWEHLTQYLHSDRWDIKISTYADMRIAPFGLTSLTERVRDLQHRHPDEYEQQEVFLAQGLELEGQLRDVTNSRLAEITSGVVEQLAEKFTVATI